LLLGTHSTSLSSPHSARDTLNGPSCFLLIVRRLFTGRSPDCYLVPLFVSPVGRWTTLLFIVVNGKLPAKAIRLLLCDPIASPCSPSHPWGQSMPILCCCGLFIDEVFIFFIHSLTHFFSNGVAVFFFVSSQRQILSSLFVVPATFLLLHGELPSSSRLYASIQSTVLFFYYSCDPVYSHRSFVNLTRRLSLDESSLFHWHEADPFFKPLVRLALKPSIVLLVISSATHVAIAIFTSLIRSLALCRLFHFYCIDTSNPPAHGRSSLIDCPSIFHS